MLNQTATSLLTSTKRVKVAAQVAPMCYRGANQFVLARLFVRALVAAAINRRFLAAARDAFLARAERSFGVMVSRLRLPPILPPLRPISLMISERNAFLRLSINPS